MEKKQSESAVAFAAKCGPGSQKQSFDAIQKMDRSTTALYNAGIEISDVKQGKMDDCYVLAPMAALANTEQGRAVLKSMIKEEPDGFHVTFPGSNRTVVVSKTDFARDGAEAQKGSTHEKDEIWVKVLESACARVAGGFTALGNCGTIDGGLGAFCKSVELLPKLDLGKIKAALDNHQPVLVGTRTLAEMTAKGAKQPEMTNDIGKQLLPDEHIMAVTKVDLSRNTIELYDSDSGEKWTVSASELERCVGDTAIGAL